MAGKGFMGGVISPTLVPFNEDGTVNYREYTRLTGYITENGADGIFVCGTTGEFVNLTIEERKRLLIAAKEGAAEGVKIMFNITAMNIHDMEVLSGWAKVNGADALSVTAPYYFTYNDSALIEYFGQASKIAGDLPLYLYNIPKTMNFISADILKTLVGSYSNIRGIKDSSMDFMTILEYQCAVEDELFEIYTGNDAQLLTTLLAGGTGGVIAVAGVFPRLCADIYDRFSQGDLDGARQAQTKVLKLRTLFRQVMPIMAHKKALEMLGFHMGPARFPFINLSVEEAQVVEETIQKLNILAQMPKLTALKRRES